MLTPRCWRYATHSRDTSKKRGPPKKKALLRETLHSKDVGAPNAETPGALMISHAPMSRLQAPGIGSVTSFEITKRDNKLLNQCNKLRRQHRNQVAKFADRFWDFKDLFSTRCLFSNCPPGSSIFPPDGSEYSAANETPQPLCDGMRTMPTIGKCVPSFQGTTNCSTKVRVLVIPPFRNRLIQISRDDVLSNFLLLSVLQKLRVPSISEKK